MPTLLINFTISQQTGSCTKWILQRKLVIFSVIMFEHVVVKRFYLTQTLRKPYWFIRKVGLIKSKGSWKHKDLKNVDPKLY